MSIEIILLALSPIFLLFVGVEFIKFRRYYDIKDSLANALLALLHQGADAIALLLLMPIFPAPCKKWVQRSMYIKRVKTKIWAPRLKRQAKRINTFFKAW